MDNPTNEIEELKTLLKELKQMTSLEEENVGLNEKTETSSIIGWTVPSPELKLRQKIKRVNYRGNKRYF